MVLLWPTMLMAKSVRYHRTPSYACARYCRTLLLHVRYCRTRHVTCATTALDKLYLRYYRTLTLHVRCYRTYKFDLRYLSLEYRILSTK